MSWSYANAEHALALTHTALIAVWADAAIRSSVARIRIWANEHKWRPIGSDENTPWVVVTIPDELEKNGQPQNEKK